MRTILLAMLLASSSQVFAQNPPMVNMQVNRNANVAQKKVDVDPVAVLRGQVAQLQKQVKELRRQLDLVMEDARAARNSIPKCSGDLMQSTSPSGTRQCEPYVCDSVVGTCLTQCVTTNDCGLGFACDVGAQRCISTR